MAQHYFRGRKGGGRRRRRKTPKVIQQLLSAAPVHGETPQAYSKNARSTLQITLGRAAPCTHTHTHSPKYTREHLFGNVRAPAAKVSKKICPNPDTQWPNLEPDLPNIVPDLARLGPTRPRVGRLCRPAREHFPTQAPRGSVRVIWEFVRCVCRVNLDYVRGVC